METTIEFMQTDGAEQTLEAAIASFKSKNPGTQVLSAKFEYAHPGNAEGRWVGIKLSFKEVFAPGDKCHYAFNGDYYPCTVTRVTRTRVYCEAEGRTFTLRRDGRFRSLGGSGTWVLHHGHRDERNPSF